MVLYKNQDEAIQISIDNQFESGIHFHATGTGKSWIALELLLAYQNINKMCNVLWICERKSILIEQFNPIKLKENGYHHINSMFQILNFSHIKSKEWVNSVNCSKFWNKPTLIIINRSFLTSNEKYKLIKIPIHLVIHDECHTIVNKSTRSFYQYLYETNPDVKSLGFSATPNIQYAPFKKILSNYSIYQAYQDNVIVQPIIKWFTSFDNMKTIEIIKTIYHLIQKLSYQKIIIWTGMIRASIKQAELWKTIFHDFLIAIDNSDSKSMEGYHSFDDFYNQDRKALLFCAGKHREGSDIRNLDGCVFLDFVQNRYSKTFVQCIGRVLRRDKNGLKKYGLIIDIKARNSTRIIQKMSEYLNIPQHIFPWNYNYKFTKNKKILVHTLILSNSSASTSCSTEKHYTIDDLYKKMIRTYPDEKIYHDRLTFEINMIVSKDLISYIMRALEILEMTKHIPHVTRGSCGSSLLCYLLGISHVDPVLYKIQFSRFLNTYRDTLPDIDFDFPYNMRDEVFLQLQMKWPGKIARISNHVYYHEKSAVRESLRHIGIKGFISKYDIHNVTSSLQRAQKRQFQDHVKKIEGTFRGYMLHCGGIVYYPEGIPKELVLSEKQSHKNNMQQIILNKHDISKNKQFKIDILSSRALAQLHEITNYTLIDFEQHYDDLKTKELLMSGDNIGLTFAESPLIRKTFMKMKPSTVEEIAVCLSIIRPAAKDARVIQSIDECENHFIFDDDAIRILSETLGCSEDMADKYRRGFAKGDQYTIDEVSIELMMKNNRYKNEVLQKLKNLRKYSFCKAHAYSYAQLVWQLAFAKAHHPFQFWKATLHHCESSYRKWVHFYEAKCVGIDCIETLFQKDDVSVFSKNRMKKFFTLTAHDQLRHYGFWEMKREFFPGCFIRPFHNSFTIRGIIASSRMLHRGKKKSIVLFIGYDKHKYCEVIIHYPKGFDGRIIGTQVNAKCTNVKQQCYEAHQYYFF